MIFVRLYFWTVQNLIGIIPWKLHALQRSEELCNRRSNRNSATQHAHKFIFYRRMHYASFRHILAAVFALLHFTRIKMNRRVLLCNVFLIVRVTGFVNGSVIRVLSATLLAYFSFFTASIRRIHRILFTALFVNFFVIRIPSCNHEFLYFIPHLSSSA